MLAFLSLCCAPGLSLAASAVKEVRYDDFRVVVPSAWPVYNLAADPAVCVRFDRHAVYLGRPSAVERCPAQAAGRTEAILIEPYTPAAGGVQLLASGSGALVRRVGRFLVSATWSRDPGTIARALGIRSLRASSPQPSEPRMARTTPSAKASSASGAAAPGDIYTGLGFDACSAPSTAQMAAWSSSSYGAAGMYIGGVNMACAQPNLTPSWVTQESADGWHLIPIYVGLQAPGNSCGCAAISPGNAAAQGRSAAADAVAKAQTLGLGPGNPIYFDMEAYDRDGTRTSAVLRFLAAWTAQLHSDGYKSGVYSSDDSGIADLVSQWGTTYNEPDEIWFASWNGVKSTSDPNIPTGEWPDHQRLHQYRGGHDETHRGVTLNIDGDYLDASTAAAGTTATAAAAPTASAPPTIAGRTVEGQTMSEAHASWSGAPTAYAYQWEDCAAHGNHCTPIPGATTQNYVLKASDLGHTIRVSESARNAGGAGAPVSSAATGEVMSPTPLYWLYTAHGNVYNSAGTAWYGSPAGTGFSGSSITGMAATSDGKGYWLVDSAGTVFPFGDAAKLSTPAPVHPIKGIVAAPGGGYWLYTAQGNVYNSAGTAWYGAPADSGFHGSSITGMAATDDGKGYWLVDSAGTVFSYGDASQPTTSAPAHPIKGIVAARGHGLWLYTARGNLYRSAGTMRYGSPAGSLHGSSIAGMAATPDGKGYWLVDSAGAVFSFGDAAKLPALAHAHPIVGVAG